MEGYAFLRFPNFKRKALTLSYDDGVVQDARLIDIMSKHGLKGTFNVNSFAGGRRAISLEQAKELYLPSGNEIACHGEKHFTLNKVPRPFAVKDICNNRQFLEREFGCIVRGMAYANGSTDDEVVQILKDCGITYGRMTGTSEGFELPTEWLKLVATCHHNHPRLMELAKTFVELKPNSYFWGNGPKLFYLWGHAYEFDDHDNWHVIEEFAEYVGNRDDIWYATNGEIYDYVQAYHSLVFSMDGKMVYNPTITDVYLNYFGKEILVPAGKTIRELY